MSSFWGTEAGTLLIGMVGYNLIHHLNRRGLKTDEECVCRLKKNRLKVLAIPALFSHLTSRHFGGHNSPNCIDPASTNRHLARVYRVIRHLHAQLHYSGLKQHYDKTSDSENLAR